MVPLFSSIISPISKKSEKSISKAKKNGNGKKKTVKTRGNKNSGKQKRSPEFFLSSDALADWRNNWSKLTKKVSTEPPKQGRAIAKTAGKESGKRSGKKTGKKRKPTFVL